MHIFIGRAAAAIGPRLLFAFLALTLVLTWPLGRLWDPVLPNHDDAQFSVWRLAWIAQQLRVEPTHLFDANIFWPERNTLAYSDAILLLGLLGAPFIWLGVHPVAVHNLLLLGGFVTAGLAAAALMRCFTASTSAQLVAGVIFAFAPYRIAHIGHLELLWTALLPVSLLALYRMLEEPSVTRGLALGAAVGLQALTSIYYVVFLVLWLVPATALAMLHVRVKWSARHVVAASAAVLTAAVLMMPYLGPYARAREDLPPRGVDEVRLYSARATDYLRVATGNLVYPTFPSDSPDERSLFVGITALSLAAMAIVLVRTRTAMALAALGVVAFDLSLGVNGVGYPWLREVVPALASFRAPARFGVLVLLAAATLAGLAVSRLLGRQPRSRRVLATAAIVGAIVIEYWSVPIGTRKVPLEPPEVYAVLAASPPTVVLELPLPTPEALWASETTYQYFSIYHWHPLVNGYSGYAPASYLRLLDVMREFPSSRAMSFLRARRVQHLIVHERLMEPDAFHAAVEACRNGQWFDHVRILAGVDRGRAFLCRVARTD